MEETTMVIQLETWLDPVARELLANGLIQATAEEVATLTESAVLFIAVPVHNN